MSGLSSAFVAPWTFTHLLRCHCRLKRSWSRLPDALLLEIARVLDIVSLWRLSFSCRRLRALILGSRSLWIDRLAAVERAANVPLTPNQTWGLAGLRNLVLRVHPRIRSPSQTDGSDAPRHMRVLQIEETVGIPWTPLGYGSAPVREPPARPQRVVGIIPIYRRSRNVIRGHSPCVLKDRCGILIGGDTQVAANTPGWSWLDIQSGRRVRFPETSVLANAGPTDEIVCLPGTDFVVHCKAANFELSLLKWDDAVEDFVPPRTVEHGELHRLGLEYFRQLTTWAIAAAQKFIVQPTAGYFVSK
ncbi:hypothetical protein DFJ73DRAFT_764702 [Zopfochytrium polystomum]|nr:hypothetical protein DFJ73DRAFT_764702 [Zopfochytrium polystomum]